VFVLDFYTSPEITAEKLTIGIIVLGLGLVLLGYKKQVYVD
jgi:hypothetical protein